MKNINKTFVAVPAQMFLIATLLSGLVCVLALRHNNEEMIKLRKAVYTADKNNTDVNAALNKLRNYVYGHMNTNLSSGNNNIKPPIQLQYTYNRLAAAQENQLQVANSQVFANAQAYCVSTSNTSFDTACVQNYVVDHGGASTNPNIPAGLYEFDFDSPTWSPDLAGWSLVIAGLSFVAFGVRLADGKLKPKK